MVTMDCWKAMKALVCSRIQTTRETVRVYSVTMYRGFGKAEWVLFSFFISFQYSCCTLLLHRMCIFLSLLVVSFSTLTLRAGEIHHCYLLIVMHPSLCANVNVLRSIFSLQWACTSSYVKLQNKPTDYKSKRKKKTYQYPAITTRTVATATTERERETFKWNGFRTRFGAECTRASWHNMIQRIPLCCVLHSFSWLRGTQCEWCLFLYVFIYVCVFFSFALPYLSMHSRTSTEQKLQQNRIQKKQDK